MRARRSIFVALLTIIFLLPLSSARANGYYNLGANWQAGWSTRAKYQATGPVPAYGSYIVAGSSGQLWLTGYRSDSDKSRGVVFESTDNGSTWTQKATFEGSAYSPAIDGSGAVYVLSYASPTRTLKKTSDEGATWTAITLPTGYWDTVTVSSDGNTIYLGGTDSINGKWLISKSTNAGATWTTQDSYELLAGRGAQEVNKIWVNWGTSEVWAVGAVWDSSWAYQWLVRKSTDGGTTWANKDVFLYPVSGNKESIAKDIYIDGSGKIYVVGYSQDSSYSDHWIVRTSTDGGTTWTLAENYFPSSTFAWAYGVSGDASGNIYVAGVGDNTGTRRSTDGGATWSTVDTFSGYVGVSVTSSGDVYTVGSNLGSAGVAEILVKKSANQGGTWTTSTQVGYEGLRKTKFSASLIDSAGTLYVGGSFDDKSFLMKSTDGGTTWSSYLDSFASNSFKSFASLAIDSTAGALYALEGATYENTGKIRKSLDGGVTWSTLDPGAGSSVYSKFIKVGNSGQIFAGYSILNDIDHHNHWIIRKSSDGGSTWTLSDDYLYGTSNCYPTGMSIGAGVIYVAGDCSSNWIVRKSADDGATWTTVSDYQYVSGRTSRAYAVVAFDASSVVVAGYGQDSSGQGHWITRRSTDGGTTWTLADDFRHNNANTNATASGAVRDVSGNLFIGGYATGGYWIVRTSTDGGVTWRTSDVFPGNSEPLSLAASPNGSSVYAVGTTSNGLVATVRRYR